MKPVPQPARQRVGIVGPCAAGKSTLIASLSPRYGEVELRHIAQEHSYVLTMWKQISNPTWLVFLDVSYPLTLLRRKLNWTEQDYQEQQRRLANARANADFYLLTDDLTPAQVAERVAEFIGQLGIHPVESAD
jgi:ATPase subunit of ABC transporter with duplicated ATPase domains